MEHFVANLVKGTQAILVDDGARTLALSISKTYQRAHLRKKTKRTALSRWSSESALARARNHACQAPPARTTARCNSLDHLDVVSIVSECKPPTNFSRWNSSSSLDPPRPAANAAMPKRPSEKNLCALPPKRPTRQVPRQNSISILRQRRSWAATA